MTGGGCCAPVTPKSSDRNRIENASGVDVAHLKSEKPTQGNKREALGAIDRKGPDSAGAAHGADLSNHVIVSRACHQKVIRVSRPQINTRAVWAHHRIMRADPFTVD